MAFLNMLLDIVQLLLTVFTFVIVAQAILSWLIALAGRRLTPWTRGRSR